MHKIGGILRAPFSLVELGAVHGDLGSSHDDCFGPLQRSPLFSLGEQLYRYLRYFGKVFFGASSVLT
jgi:hypothetical protein